MDHSINRFANKYHIYSWLSKSSDANLVNTITDCFYIRDHRKGKGERKLGRICFNWIADHHPMIFLRVMKFIPEFGRWDDLLHITNELLQPYIYKYISNQIHHDILQMSIGYPISTCAKWLPSEGKSFARHHSIQFKLLLQNLGMNMKEYRIKMSTLRKYIYIPEHDICTKNYPSLHNRLLTHGAKKMYRNILNPVTYEPLTKDFRFRIKNDNNYILIKEQIPIKT